MRIDNTINTTNNTNNVVINNMQIMPCGVHTLILLLLLLLLIIINKRTVRISMCVCNDSYKEFTRLAETRLAQNSLSYIRIYQLA